ncbi:PEGA domain-containing protein [Candidatus Latescibacterota bacterium]
MRSYRFLLHLAIATPLMMASCSGSDNVTDPDDTVYGVSVSTSPAGATIYLDGTPIAEASPTLVTDVTAGEHQIRMYKDGYNEHVETFTYEADTVYSINVTLSTPEPPYPVITFSSPANNATFTDNVVSISGTIILDNDEPFTGTSAILTLNGIDKQISVVDGAFTDTNSIFIGTNTIVVRANGPYGDTGVSETLTINGNFVEPDIEITLTWNTPTSDIDLHVWNPTDEHSYYENKSISDGSLDIDDVDGYGPETFTALTGLDGVYTVMLNSYSLDQDTYADATVVINIKGQSAQVFGPHHFTVDDYNGSTPEAWWDVATFTVSGGVAKLATSATLAEKIATDMIALPQK